jgi:hypothetical protein
LIFGENWKNTKTNFRGFQLINFANYNPFCD